MHLAAWASLQAWEQPDHLGCSAWSLIWALAAATTASDVKPKCFSKSLRGADAPKDRMPMEWPAGPIYWDQPKVAPISTETRAFTDPGRTSSRYPEFFWQCFSNS